VTKSYIEFHEVPSASKKTKRWQVVNTSHKLLGYIKFYPQWRCYTFRPLGLADTVFNAGCLNDIAFFCDQQTAVWRAELKTKTA
jgi:hypothetical protein